MMTGRPLSIDDALLRHAAGALDAGFSLLIETHLDLSPAARAAHARFEALGGLFLEEMEPAEVDPAALNKALGALDDEAPPTRRAPDRAPQHPAMPEGFSLPPTLARQAIRRWRWIAPGVRAAAIALPETAASRAFLLEIAPGVRVPEHGHDGEEFTCVLRGGFVDGAAHYAVGDVAVADAESVHDIVIDSDSSCLCLVAMEGRTRPSHWFGRLYQKFRDI